MEEEVFKKCTIDNKKLIDYGFIKENNKYIYSTNIINNTLEVIIEINNNKIKGKIIDKELDDEYYGYRIEKNIGEFANTVKCEYLNILEDIKNKCAIESIYISPQANRITKKIYDKYKDKPEFLWDDDKNSVFRNKNNKKWYGIIMYINKNKIANEDKMVEVMNVKLPTEKIENLLCKKEYYKAYHMNKKYWITFILDDSLQDDEILENIEESHNYTIETNEWVIPANPNFFDIIAYFKNKDKIYWHQSSSMNLGDNVYVYLGKPYSSIKFKCIITEKDIDSNYDDRKLMKLKLIKEYKDNQYTFDIISKYDLKAIRGARRMPIKLINKMKEDEKND